MRRKSCFEIQQKVQKLKPEYQKMLEDCLVLFKKCNVDYKQDRENMMVQFYNLLKCHYEVLTPNVTEEEFREDSALSNTTELHVLNRPKAEPPKAKLPKNAKSVTVSYIEQPDGSIDINFDTWETGTNVLRILTAGIISLLQLEPLQTKKLVECINSLHEDENSKGKEPTTNTRKQPSLGGVKSINNKRNRRSPWAWR